MQKSYFGRTYKKFSVKRLIHFLF